MNTTDLITAFRQEMRDMEAPYLWSDTTVMRYLDDAQTMFCRLTNGIEDTTTPEICRINLRPNVYWYDLDRRILSIRRAMRLDRGHDVPVTTIEKARAEGYKISEDVGELRALIVGATQGKIRVVNVPAESIRLELSVFRMPLEPLTCLGQAIEIELQHHDHLLLWMKHKAYDVQDAEVFDRTKSNEYDQRFQIYCAKVVAEQNRKRRMPGGIMYGGIPLNTRADTNWQMGSW